MMNVNVQHTDREDLLEQIFAVVLDGVVLIDCTTGRIIDLNPKAAEIIGCPKDEILGKASHRFIGPAPVGESPIYDLDLASEQSESVVRRIDGREIPVSKTTARLQWQGRDCLVESFTDLSPQKETQQAQAQLVQELERVNQELKNFAYVVSHDLKAPLRGIKHLAGWIAEDYADKLDEEGREQFSLLVNRVDRMHDLIQGILEYSQIGRVIEKQECINLNDLLPIVVDTLAVPNHMEICIEKELPAIQAEKTRIVQVFQNLLSNAVKYMDKEQGRILVACTDQGEHWQFSVADNGPGIGEKDQARVFKLFQTLVSKDEHESTGVGLTIVKRIVEFYGGRIWVESQSGQGCTFFFTLAKADENKV
jgi:two-component system, LuxR family, sensor kinase FixL